MSQSLSLRRILIFWAPLFSTWLMMAFEGPFLAAIIARLPDPKFNLAAHGVAFSLALIVEAPIIMMMSASTALVHSRQSYLALRNYTARLNVAITAAMLLLGIPSLFFALMKGAIGLPDEVAWRAHLAVLLLLPWPGAIGFRRFYQGLLIRRNRTREVAYGTVLRLASMTATALLLTAFTRVEGVAVGAASLSAGVVAEAFASRWMVRRIVRELLGSKENGSASPALTNSAIRAFYYPLIITSVLTLAAQPLITFFVGSSRNAVESLAVLPVVSALVMVFRSVGLSYQEVAVAFLVQDPGAERSVRKFAGILAAVAGGGLAGVNRICKNIFLRFADF